MSRTGEVGKPSVVQLRPCTVSIILRSFHALRRERHLHLRSHSAAPCFEMLSFLGAFDHLVRVVFSGDIF